MEQILSPLIGQRADPCIVRHSEGDCSYGEMAWAPELHLNQENYAMGLPCADDDANLIDPASWIKLVQPVLPTCYQHGSYGAGHNGFTCAEDGDTVLLVYPARTDTQIVNDPLWNPDRHTFVKRLRWDERGMPLFGRPSVD
jgi:GH43 family beta-xylosidase